VKHLLGVVGEDSEGRVKHDAPFAVFASRLVWGLVLFFSGLVCARRVIRGVREAWRGRSGHGGGGCE